VNDNPSENLTPFGDDDFGPFAGAESFANGDRPLIGHLTETVTVIIDATGCCVNWLHPNGVTIDVYQHNKQLPNAEYAKGYYHDITADDDLKERNLIAFGFEHVGII
jgi:hypothetical protein